MNKTHKFEEMFPRDFKREFERCPVIYCPFGGVEYHGSYQALGSDFVKGHVICERVAQKIGGVVHPVIPIVPAGAFPSFTFEEMRDKVDFSINPAVFAGRELCRAICEELFRFFSECLKFKVCVAFGAHGPAGALVKKIEEECQGRVGNMRLLATDSTGPIKDLIDAEHFKHGLTEYQGHGGMWETSIYMACRPDVMDMEALENYDAETSEFKKTHPMTLKGCRLSTAAFGEKLIEAYVERFSARVLAALKEVQ